VEAAFGQPPQQVELIENATRFIAPLWSGQKTGWFYDHRMNRARMRDYVKGKAVLDVFSYLGGWGITAAQYGASSVTCVDASKSACELIAHNAALNLCADKITVICDDAFEALKKLIQAGQQYDVVIVDPPAFIKRQKDQKEGFLAYQRINEQALKLTKIGGILASSSCSMHLKDEDLQQAVQRAAIRSKSTLQILEWGHQAPDHPIHPAIAETRYIKMLLARKLQC
jgi:23S rRNA (cytosine1962-C5)-methyltransferase